MTLYVWSVAWPVHPVNTSGIRLCLCHLLVSISVCCLWGGLTLPSNVCCCISFLHWSVCGVQCCATQLTHTLPLFNSYPACVTVCECTHMSLTRIQQCCVCEGQGGGLIGWLNAFTISRLGLACACGVSAFHPYRHANCVAAV